MSAAYPHKCKLCHFPARIGKVVLCSNYKCKASKAYRTILTRIKPVIYPDRDAVGFLICPVCGSRGQYDNEVYNYLQSKRIRCNKEHIWSIVRQKGDRLDYYGRDMIRYLEWNGSDWVEQNSGWDKHDF